MSTLAFSSGGKTGRSHRPPVRLSHRVHVAGRLVGHAMFAMGLTLAVAGAAHAASTITRTNLTGTTFLNPCTAEQITIVGGTFQLISHPGHTALIASFPLTGAA